MPAGYLNGVYYPDLMADPEYAAAAANWAQTIYAGPLTAAQYIERFGFVPAAAGIPPAEIPPGAPVVAMVPGVAQGLMIAPTTGLQPVTAAVPAPPIPMAPPDTAAASVVYQPRYTRPSVGSTSSLYPAVTYGVGGRPPLPGAATQVRAQGNQFAMQLRRYLYMLLLAQARRRGYQPFGR